MSEEEIISLNRMKLFARSSDLSVVSAKDMEIVVNLIETQQKEIEYWKERAEGYSGLAEQIKEDFENRDRWE